jgi:hypothetical protein
MKGEELIGNYKIGDKVVMTQKSLDEYIYVYGEDDLSFYKDVVYGILTGQESRYPEHIIVNWVNHKGIIVRSKWYSKLSEIKLYEG